MNSHPLSFPRCRAAFTLIELMIVVAILALLMALLFPALSNSRARAKTIACVNNQRQIGVVIRAWTGDNNGNFIGIGEPNSGARLHWVDQLTDKGYLGKKITVTKQHVDNRYGVGPTGGAQILRCPSEATWKTMNTGSGHSASPDPYYSGVPYNNFTHEYMNTSYDINFTVINLTHCNCQREGNGTWCSSAYCGSSDANCCAIGFSAPDRENMMLDGTLVRVTPQNALILMDNRIYNYIAWMLPHFYGWNAYGTKLGMYSDGTPFSIVDDPVEMHAYRHGNKRANGLFLDGHVAFVRPAELTPLAERVQFRVWKGDYLFAHEYGGGW